MLQGFGKTGPNKRRQQLVRAALAADTSASGCAARYSATTLSASFKQPYLYLLNHADVSRMLQVRLGRVPIEEFKRESPRGPLPRIVNRLERCCYNCAPIDGIAGVYPAETLAHVMQRTVLDSAVIGDYDTIKVTLERSVQNSKFAAASFIDVGGPTIRASNPVTAPDRPPELLRKLISQRLYDVNLPIEVGGRDYGVLRLSFDVDLVGDDARGLDRRDDDDDRLQRLVDLARRLGHPHGLGRLLDRARHRQRHRHRRDRDPRLLHARGHGRHRHLHGDRGVARDRHPRDRRPLPG